MRVPGRSELPRAWRTQYVGIGNRDGPPPFAAQLVPTARPPWPRTSASFCRSPTLHHSITLRLRGSPGLHCCSRVGHGLSRVVSRVGREKRPVFIDLSRCHGSRPPKGPGGANPRSKVRKFGGSSSAMPDPGCGESANAALYRAKPRSLESAENSTYGNELTAFGGVRRIFLISGRLLRFFTGKF